MTPGREELALRKQLLVAQSALYRAQLRCEVAALRSRATRVSGWIAMGISAVSAVRTVLAIVALLRK